MSAQKKQTIKPADFTPRFWLIKMLWVGVILLSGIPVAHAVSGKDHDALARLLLKTPVADGGSMGLDESKVRKVSAWMDNPVQRPGQYHINDLAGKPWVTPWNHQHVRHNPERTAKALSGKSTVDPALLNQARVHKIADIYATKASGVDGWEISHAMKIEARDFVAYIRQNKSLPSPLPAWVDESGPMLVRRANAMRAAQSASKESSKAASAVDDAVRAAGDAAEQSAKAAKFIKVAGPVALAIECCVRGKDAYDTEKAYERGEIDEDERIRNHARNGGQMAGGVGGAAAGAWAGAALGACTGPAAPVCVPVCAIVGGVAGGLGGDALGGRTAVAIAENRQLIQAEYKRVKDNIKVSLGKFDDRARAACGKAKRYLEKLF